MINAIIGTPEQIEQARKMLEFGPHVTEVWEFANTVSFLKEARQHPFPLNQIVIHNPIRSPKELRKMIYEIEPKATVLIIQ